MSRLINDELLKESIREKTLFVKWQKVLIEMVIDDQPTVDAVPVVHAQWFTSYDGMLHCSHCFETPTNRVMVRAELIYDMTPIREKMHYCPNCGARMDGEV